MTTQDFYKLIDQVVEVEPGTVKGSEQLAEFKAWDSLAAVGFIAAVDETLGVIVPAKQLIAAKSVEDLRLLVAGNLAD